MHGRALGLSCNVAETQGEGRKRIHDMVHLLRRVRVVGHNAHVADTDERCARAVSVLFCIAKAKVGQSFGSWLLLARTVLAGTTHSLSSRFFSRCSFSSRSSVAVCISENSMVR